MDAFLGMCFSKFLSKVTVVTPNVCKYYTNMCTDIAILNSHNQTDTMSFGLMNSACQVH